MRLGAINLIRSHLGTGLDVTALRTLSARARVRTTGEALQSLAGFEPSRG